MPGHTSCKIQLRLQPPCNTLLQAKPQYSLFTTTPMPCPSKRHCHRTPASGSQHPSTDFSRCRRRALLTPFPATHIRLEPSVRLRGFLSHVKKLSSQYTLVSGIFHSVQSIHRDYMLSLPSQATRAQRLPGHHSRTRVVLRRRALLHVPQTVLRKVCRPSCAVEPMPLLGLSRPRSPQQGVPRL